MTASGLFLSLKIIIMKGINQFKGLLAILILTVFFSVDSFSQGKSKSNGPLNWAPAHGYRATTRQIYFPDQNVYYDVQKGVYISLSGSNWQVSASLPSIFSGVDLNVSAKIELDLDTDTPQKYNKEHKEKAKDNKPKSKSNNGKGKKN